MSLAVNEKEPHIKQFLPLSIFELDPGRLPAIFHMTPEEYLNRLWGVCARDDNLAHLWGVGAQNENGEIFITYPELQNYLHEIRIVTPGLENRALQWQLEQIRSLHEQSKIVVLTGGGKSGTRLEQRIHEQISPKVNALSVTPSTDELHLGDFLRSINPDNIIVAEDWAPSGAQLETIIGKINFPAQRRILVGGLSARALSRFSKTQVDSYYYMPNGEEIDDKLTPGGGVRPSSKLRYSLAAYMWLHYDPREIPGIHRGEAEHIINGNLISLDELPRRSWVVRADKVPDDFSFPSVLTSNGGLWVPNADHTDMEKLCLFNYLG